MTLFESIFYIFRFPPRSPKGTISRKDEESVSTSDFSDSKSFLPGQKQQHVLGDSSNSSSSERPLTKLLELSSDSSDELKSLECYSFGVIGTIGVGFNPSFLGGWSCLWPSPDLTRDSDSNG